MSGGFAPPYIPHTRACARAVNFLLFLFSVIFGLAHIHSGHSLAQSCQHVLPNTEHFSVIVENNFYYYNFYS